MSLHQSLLSKLSRLICSEKISIKMAGSASRPWGKSPISSPVPATILSCACESSIYCCRGFPTRRSSPFYNIRSRAQARRDEPERNDDLNILHWDCRGLVGHTFTPSGQLVKSATNSKQSVLHVWNRALVTQSSYTHSENVDWAFCTPVESDACPGWSIYVAGNLARPTTPEQHRR